LKVVGVIPARFGSVRFPGKALYPLHGKPLVVHTLDRARAALKLDEVYVATDHDDIAEAIRDAGGDVVMTSPACATGSDRIAEVVRARGADWDIVVNIQGDEPYIDPAVIDAVVKALIDSTDCGVSTAMVAIRRHDDFESPHNVKAVATPDGRALYFSRSPIPSPARLTDEELNAPNFFWGMKHLGLYAFRKEILLQYTNWTQTPLEQRERLEQLRLMEHGVKIRLVEVEHDSIGVDTPEELERLIKTPKPLH